MPKRLPSHPGHNSLLATLPEAERANLEPALEPITLAIRIPLEIPGKPLKKVYFPIDCIGSTVAIGREGRRIETGLFGREGMSGMSVVTGAGTSPNETFVQIPGRAMMMEADRLRELLDRNWVLQRHLSLFVHVMAIQTSHTALSNGHSKLEERLARWLLMCHDRLDGDKLSLTHEFLSVMLGVRRAGVTVGTHHLEGKGLIRANRGEIVVVDREGLEDEARGSYGIPEAEYVRLIGGPVPDEDEDEDEPG